MAIIQFGENGEEDSSHPNYPHYANPNNRLASYQGWPHHVHQTPAQLVEAGFFSIGIGDKVQCYHCGGGVKDWEPSDDPWVEHAKWYPHCKFLILKKGHQFIAAAWENLLPEAIQQQLSLTSGTEAAPQVAEPQAAASEAENTMEGAAGGEESPQTSKDNSKQEDEDDVIWLCLLCHVNPVEMETYCDCQGACSDCLLKNNGECPICDDTDEDDDE